jgi:hypothetical protein
MKYISILIFIIFTQPAIAGWLVTNAKIKEVASAIGTQEAFFIVLDGGSGMCADKQIVFSMNHIGSEKKYDRAFSIALAAYMSDQKIKIYDYNDGIDDCSNADSIRVYK